MKKFVTMLLRHWSKAPVKVALTILSVALGTGILILSFSASAILKEQVSDRMDRNGTILYVSNGVQGADGSIEQTRPSEWDSTALDTVASGMQNPTTAALVSTPPFTEIATNGKSYQLRSAVGTDPNYFDVFSLELAAGVPMSVGDVTGGLKKVWISETMADLLYGSAEAAIGQSIQPPGMMFRRGPGEAQQQAIIPSYSVAGVFASPAEVLRRSYGIGDLLFPYTSLIPAGMNASFVKNMMSGLFVVKVEGAGAAKANSSIRQILSAEFGEDIDIAVWEGKARGVSEYMSELRQAVNIFTIAVNILGMVLLVISSLGIFSIMVVEALGKRRDIALERAIGASQGVVVREFWTWSTSLSCMGAALGIVLALVLAKPVLGSLAPLVGEVSDEFVKAAGIQAEAIFAGLALALGCGGVLGLLPAFSAVKGNISETLREV